MRFAGIVPQNRQVIVFEKIFRKTEKIPFLRLPHAKYYYHNNFLAAKARRKRKLISNNSARDEPRTEKRLKMMGEKITFEEAIVDRLEMVVDVLERIAEALEEGNEDDD